MSTRAFVALCAALERNGRAEAQGATLHWYFSTADAHDAAWAVALLTGVEFPVRVRPAEFRVLALAVSGLPAWLFEVSYKVVDDLVETAALVVPVAEADDVALASLIEQRLLPLQGLPAQARHARIGELWHDLDRGGRVLVGKMLARSFRSPVLASVVHRALAKRIGATASAVAERLRGPIVPSAAFWEDLRSHGPTTVAMPPELVPLAPTVPLADDLDGLGARDAWQAEWQWSGLRVQLAVDRSGVRIESERQESLLDALPEIVSAAESLPARTLLDGVVVAWDPALDRAGDPKLLAARLRRSRPRTPVPVAMLAFDLLCLGGEDLRARALSFRRERLEALLPAHHGVRAAPVLRHDTWGALARACRTPPTGTRGLVLKRLDSAYGEADAWRTWEGAPHAIRAVLMYAQPGRGGHASVYSEYTFGVRDDATLVSVGRADVGLDEGELRALDYWVRTHTVEKFGPVRSVELTQLFELAAGEVRRSRRHKSGIELRGLRIVRWCRDGGSEQADSLEQVRALAAATD